MAGLEHQNTGALFHLANFRVKRKGFFHAGEKLAVSSADQWVNRNNVELSFLSKETTQRQRPGSNQTVSPSPASIRFFLLCGWKSLICNSCYLIKIVVIFVVVVVVVCCCCYHRPSDQKSNALSTRPRRLYTRS